MKHDMAFLRSTTILGRHRTVDSPLTFDSAHRTHDASGNAIGVPLGGRYKQRDYQAADGTWKTGRTYDSSGAFYIGELERLDQTLHPPLAAGRGAATLIFVRT